VGFANCIFGSLVPAAAVAWRLVELNTCGGWLNFCPIMASIFS
jgi:hypothetical protein